MRILILISAMLLCSLSGARAQGGEWGVGFELGWSGNVLQGEMEQNAAGEEVEDRQLNSGFHLLVFTRYNFTDQFNIQMGLEYNQRGAEYEWQGDSYFIFNPLDADTRKIAYGKRSELGRVTNYYLDIPVVVNYNIGKHFQLGAGVYGGLLLSSRNQGDLTMTRGDSPFSDFDEVLPLLMDYNYRKDRAGEGESSTIRFHKVDGQTYVVPVTIKANFMFSEEPEDNLYKNLDFGLMGQFGYYFNKSLNLKFKVKWGMTDISNNGRDISKGMLDDDGDFIYRSDKDRNLDFQISLGFNF